MKMWTIHFWTNQQFQERLNYGFAASILLIDHFKPFQGQWRIKRQKGQKIEENVIHHECLWRRKLFCFNSNQLCTMYSFEILWKKVFEYCSQYLTGNCLNNMMFLVRIVSSFMFWMSENYIQWMQLYIQIELPQRTYAHCIYNKLVLSTHMITVHSRLTTSSTHVPANSLISVQNTISINARTSKILACLAKRKDHYIHLIAKRENFW